MIDPHVVSLTYRLETSSDLTFDNPPPVERVTDAFRARLSDGTLSIEMKEHFPSAESALKAVAGFLRAWELGAALQYGRGALKFVYQDANVIDRSPLPPGTGRVFKTLAAAYLTATGSIEFRVTRRAYPEPPENFIATSEVETLWFRYKRYLDQQEPILSMAYFCLTLIEAAAGGRRGAANRYQIQYDVLNKLGELTSKRGDEKQARKMKGAGLIPLSGEEIAWIEAVIKAIIRRAGEIGIPTSLPIISMKDLPTI